MLAVRVLRTSDDDEMVACFLAGELSSERFGAGVREQLAQVGASQELLTRPDLRDVGDNELRRAMLGALRGYGENRELFEHFPSQVRWFWASLTPEELSKTRYVEYSYWSEISGGSRLPSDAEGRIRAGRTAFSVPNQRFLQAARALAHGARFPALILVGGRADDLVCLEGNLRLTAYALAGFPAAVDCLVGLAPDMERWSC